MIATKMESRFMKVIFLTAAVLFTVSVTTTLSNAQDASKTSPIPPPKKTGPCNGYDHLPGMCEYRVYLTDEQFKTVQQFHSQNITKVQEFLKTQSK
jgi:hypothetical protein